MDSYTYTYNIKTKCMLSGVIMKLFCKRHNVILRKSPICGFDYEMTCHKPTNAAEHVIVMNTIHSFFARFATIVVVDVSDERQTYMSEYEWSEWHWNAMLKLSMPKRNTAITDAMIDNPHISISELLNDCGEYSVIDMRPKAG